MEFEWNFFPGFTIAALQESPRVLVEYERSTALSSIASESLVKSRYKSQNPLSPQVEKYHRTERPVVCSDGAHRPVVCAHSSSYSEWNVDETWSSQEWKSDELMENRTERFVLFAHHTDNFIVGNDEMNFYTEADQKCR